MPSGDDVPEQAAEQIADIMFALSSPARVRLLSELLAGPCSVSELMEATGMEQSAVSHQLRVLREHRLVDVKRDGRRRVYAVTDQDIASLLDAARRHALRSVRGRAATAIGKVLRRAN
jgi:DNA-binding transcriptional ArsR family regulator